MPPPSPPTGPPAPDSSTPGSDTIGETSTETSSDQLAAAPDRPGQVRTSGDPVAAVAAMVELDRSLREIARRASVQVGVADGVGATLLVQGREVFAGSNPFTEAVDAVQYGLHLGPCVAAVASERVVRSRTIGTGERRWGQFTPEAAALELRSVVSTPVWSGRRVIGSLNLYGRHATSFDTADTASVQRDTEHLTRAMTTAWLLAVAAANAQVLVRAVRDREDVDVAVGLLMDRYRMTASHARILIGQLAAQDGVSEPVAARSLTHLQASPADEPDHRGP
ncbi:MAG: GAF domain-containing protein [Propionibacteriaceae bacterium]|nr:MAG: GAF domain-containing protein [Propionibacteriaceae bacterium]